MRGAGGLAMTTTTSDTTPPDGQAAAPTAGDADTQRIALVGNPNTGKTTLFNRLSGLRLKTANFPGTTVEARVGRARLGAGDAPAELIDLPGVYSLELDQIEAEVCRRVLAGVTAPRGESAGAPSAVCVVVDASNLARNLMLVGEALRRRLPTVVALNMTDVAERLGLRVDAAALEQALGCAVVPVCARSGENFDALRAALTDPRVPRTTPGAEEEALQSWAEELAALALRAEGPTVRETVTDRLDRAFTHPVLGLIVFAALMTGLFWALFRLATWPMAWIEGAFGALGAGVEAAMPAGILTDLLVNGVIAGVAGTVVFLPQICLLFFLLSLLEDTGYLARAAFVVDRLLRPFGLPGHSFVPLLSSHACALPGIMGARVIPDRRERLATILVAPFMTCSARLPVYVLLLSLLFRDRPAMAALGFVGCYALGIVAGVGTALLARRTILRGKTRAMALELPSYKRPSLRTALTTAYDRGMLFLRKAGTVILAISIVLWWLSAYPVAQPPAESVALRAQAAQVEATAPEQAAALQAQAASIERTDALAHSFAGRIGRTIEPALSPLGFDWQISIGVVTSFAAREVFVSTMAVIFAGDEEAADESLLDAIRNAKRDDGVTPVFTAPVAWSLLVFYVLAMQCLPTLAVTAREAGGARWALLQLVWMSGVAYVAALVAFHLARALGA
jgi:ferrous iron transport protein B